MEQQQAQQIEQQLRQNWRQIRYRILDQFAQVSPADLDSAVNVNDLVQRIADKTHHSERYVETRMLELVGATAGQGGPSMPMGMPMGMQGGQAGQPSAASQGQPFGGAGQ
jgi:hypothetical protein